MPISYLDVISTVYHNYVFILSPNNIYSLLGNENIEDVTTVEDQDPDFPIPFYAKVFEFKPKEAYLGVLETDFSLSGKLLNCRIVLHFGNIGEGTIKAKEFFHNHLLPHVRDLVKPAKEIPNPVITGYTFHINDLEVTTRWVLRVCLVFQPI